MKHSLNELYQQSRQKFAERYDAQEASAVAFALLEDLYEVTRTDVLLDRPIELSEEEIFSYEEKVRQIASGVPLQHATGRALFAGRYFKVTPDTLIPRPETEKVPLLLPPSGGGAVLDCGTGTGCIAITIALEHPDWQVEAWDISEGALAVAKENAESLGAKNVTFLHRDILAEARHATLHSPHPTLLSSHSALHSSLITYNYIVSNPPYICNKEAAEMEAHVLDHEPHTALFVPDDDPLLFYRALAEIARVRLAPGGYLIVECNRAYTEETAALFEDHGFVDVAIMDDCFGAPRFVRGFRA